MLPNEPIETFQLEQSSTSSHTTTFYDSHILTTDTTLRPTDADRPTPCDISDITNFLKIPRPIFDGLWGTAAAGPSLVTTLSVPYALLSIPRVAAKVDHFKYLRADIRISIRINASAHHQGRLLISYSPRFNNRTAIPYAEASFTHHSSLQHIQVDLGRGNNATMLIPYTLPCEFMDLDKFDTALSTKYEMGVIFIWVMNQLRSDSSTAVNYKVYANFENITLSGSCGPTQRVFANPTLPMPDVPFQDTCVVDYIYDHETDNGIVTQMEPSTEDKEKSETGLVSGIMETAASFLKPFSVLPIVGDFATAFADGATAIGGIAKSIGFSNPPDLRAPEMVITGMYNSNLSSGLATGLSLTHNAGDLVQSAAHLLSSIPNEMELSKIISTPTFHSKFTIKPTDVEGHNLWYYRLSPINVGYNTSTKCIYHSPLSFVATTFTHWRGSMRFHLSFVTNAFSAARVRVMWIPPGFDVPQTNSDSAEYMSSVVDIVGPTEYSFTVPYCASTPWLDIKVTKENHALGTYGAMAIHLENALVSNLANPLPIECNIWVSGGADMQFSRFTDSRMNIRFQSDNSPTACLDLESIRKADYKPLASGLFYNEHFLCNPDSITSVKQICSRLGFLQIAPLASGTDTFTSPFLPSSNKVQPIIQWFSYLYRYARGSFRFMITNYDAGGYVNIDNAIMPQSNNHAWVNVTTGPYINKRTAAHLSGGITYVSRLGPQIIVNVPYYSSTYAIMLSRHDSIVRDQAVPGIFLNGIIGSSIYFMGVGDDFEFIGLLGGPTLESDLTMYSYKILTN